MFAPVVFVHPLRVRRLRPLTIAATLVWFALAAVAIVEGSAAAGLGQDRPGALAVYFLSLPLARRLALAAPLSGGGESALPARGETCYSPPRCGREDRVAAWPRGGVATQRTANPCTPVRFRARPPLPSFGAPPATAPCRNRGGAMSNGFDGFGQGRRGAAAARWSTASCASATSTISTCWRRFSIRRASVFVAPEMARFAYLDSDQPSLGSQTRRLLRADRRWRGCSRRRR